MEEEHCSSGQGSLGHRIWHRELDMTERSDGIQILAEPVANEEKGLVLGSRRSRGGCSEFKRPPKKKSEMCVDLLIFSEWEA